MRNVVTLRRENILWKYVQCLLKYIKYGWLIAKIQARNDEISELILLFYQPIS